MRAPSRLALVAVAALGLSASACKMAAERGATEPQMDSKAAAEDPLAELERLEQQMQALGIAVASPTAPGAGAGAGIGPDGEAVSPSEAGGEAEAQAVAEEPTADETAVSPGPVPPRAEQRDRVQQCNAVCDLSVAICDLEVRICGLSESHQGDPTFADACRRASDDCEVANYECDRCDVG